MPVVLLNKPFRVLCQFSDPQGRPTLADYVDMPDVYAAGRLDYDSEGLVALTDDGALQARIAEPRRKLIKRYWVQVEGNSDSDAMQRLQDGVVIKDGEARAVTARCIDEPDGMWPRQPPIRVRKNIPDNWIDVALDEGRNRQLRRMTAAVGLPTLRLIRHAIGPWSLRGLAPGESIVLSNSQAWRDLRAKPPARNQR